MVFSDDQLSILRDTLGEDAEILDADDSVLATVRGQFRRLTGDLDFGGPNYSEVPYNATTEEVQFMCRQADVSAWVGKRLRLKSGYRTGVEHPVIYRIVDRIDDGHGVTRLMLDR